MYTHYIIYLYSESSNSVNFCPKNTLPYSKPHYLYLYYLGCVSKFTLLHGIVLFSKKDQIFWDQKVNHVIVKLHYLSSYYSRTYCIQIHNSIGILILSKNPNSWKPLKYKPSGYRIFFSKSPFCKLALRKSQSTYILHSFEISAKLCKYLITSSLALMVNPKARDWFPFVSSFPKKHLQAGRQSCIINNYYYGPSQRLNDLLRK